MAGQASKKRSIPAWQQTYFEDKAKAEESPSPSSTSVPSSNPTSQSQGIEQAALLLQDDSIRSEPVESKRRYLEERGISKEDIASLLQNATEEPSELKTVLDSTTSSPSSTMSTRPDDEPATSTPSQTQSRDTPPIITYPEFLLRPEKPPPLITIQRLLYATYGISAVAATAWGANKYLVEPMLNSLSESRHDLFHSTLDLLQKLNEKLEANVSTIPAIPSKPRHHDRYTDDDGASSIASDPTELFHRDIATQTSPSHTPPDPSSSPGFPSTSIPSQSQRSDQNTTSHTTRLTTIRSNLSYLLANESSPSDPSPESNNLPTDLQTQTSDRLRDLQTYLDSLGFSPYSSSSSSHIPGFSDTPYTTDDFLSAGSNPAAFGSGGSRSMTSTTTTGGKRAGKGATAAVPPEDDEIAKMKQEIRGLKGQLLSSRNFPMAPNRGAVK